MLRTMMKSKIHRATVTQADLHYVGSVTVDEDLLDAADLLPGELVHIVQPGDIVILIGYAQMETAEARELQPSVVFVDADNKVVGTGHDPAEALPGTGLVRGDALAR